jgi:hypothetical protein
VFQSTDLLNGRLLCGCQDIRACSVSSLRYTAFSIDVDGHVLVLLCYRTNDVNSPIFPFPFAARLWCSVLRINL